MIIQLNFKSGMPVYLQVVDQVKLAAASGVLRAGEPLPSIRPLAEQLRINRNTVAKAYAELESQGIIETIAGKGCFVTENNSPFKKEVRQKMLADAIDAAVVQAHHLQVNEKDFLLLVKQRLQIFEQRNKTNAEKKQ
jgi:GntR family transcriptional regulator